MKNPEEVYTDGGVILKNPSSDGGTWAYCWVECGERIRESSGVICAKPWLPYGGISNNATELIAVAMALASLPGGWSGVLCTDSEVTISRVLRLSSGSRPQGVPGKILSRLEFDLARLGGFTMRRLGGHPTKSELAVGRRKDGAPVSVHNCWCDKACTARAREFRRVPDS